MTTKEIIAKLPYQYPFLFVDEIISVDENTITGTYTYDSNLPFYQGHFKNNPITPGVILTETMAQIGLVALGIYITREMKEPCATAPPDTNRAIGAEIDTTWDKLQIAFTSADVHFYKPVLPEEKVIVKSVKEYFRFNKLKCNVEMYNEKAELVCRGTLAGMIKKEE